MNKRGWYVYIHKSSGTLSRLEPRGGPDNPSFDALDPDTYTFEATLRYYDIERGRSAAHFRWMDIARTVPGEWHRPRPWLYVMFMQQIGEMLKEGIAITETMHGVWCVVKRGTDYGIKLVRLLEGETP